MTSRSPRLKPSSSTGGTISAQSSFLTAPHAPVDLHDIPWRPSRDDDTSLRMKRRHHKHSENGSNLDVVPSRRVQTSERSGNNISMLAGRTRISHQNLYRCRSLEELYRYRSGSKSSTSVKVNVERLEEDNERGTRERRWTLPSKSEATRGFTPLKSTVKKATLQQDTDSPAMITLRRATNNPTPRKSEITFFPEPTFSHERNGLLSYLISTFNRAGTFNGTTPDLLDNRGHGSRSGSVDSNTAHGTVTVPAATVCTETTVDASLTMLGAMQDSFARRRCSTKYTSGSTVYEIIWDENDSLSNGNSSSRASLGTRRRSSLAMLTLEAQLAKSQDPSRRHSQASAAQTRQSSVKSVDMFPERTLTISKLETILPRLLHKTGLRDLPRSRAKRQRRSTVCSMTVEEADPRTILGGDAGERKLSTSGIDFFPPLKNRENSGTVGTGRQGWGTSDAEMGLAEAFNKSHIWSPHSNGFLSCIINSSGPKKRRGSSCVTTAIGTFRQPFRQVNQVNDDEELGQYEDDRQPLLE